MQAASPRFHRQLASTALGLCLALAAGSCLAGPRIPGVSPDGVPQRLILALDGIPYDVFVDMQRQGHFANFRPAARMVSTFPSLSDVSFAAIGGSEPPEGYQNMRFDSVRNRVVGNTLGSLSSRLHPNLAADSPARSSAHRMVGYMAAYRVSLRDMRAMGREVLLSPNATYVAYLEETDAVLHVQGRRGAERFLVKLDAFLLDLQAQVRARTGRELLVDVVSDHGSTMMKGEVVRLEPRLRECGFDRRSRLDRPTDVAYSLAGIINSVAISVARPQAEAVGRCLALLEGVDLVAIDRGDAVGIVTADAEAEIRLEPGEGERYRYTALRGDPLGLLTGSTTRERLFNQAESFQASRDGSRPDPLRRLWMAFHGAVRQPTPVLLSLADGYEAGNAEVRALAKIRGRAGTHGSMTRLASLGVFASTWRDVADVNAWTAHEQIFGAATAAAQASASGLERADQRVISLGR